MSAKSEFQQSAEESAPRKIVYSWYILDGEPLRAAQRMLYLKTHRINPDAAEVYTLKRYLGLNSPVVIGNKNHFPDVLHVQIENEDYFYIRSPHGWEPDMGEWHARPGNSKPCIGPTISMLEKFMSTPDSSIDLVSYHKPEALEVFSRR